MVIALVTMPPAEAVPCRRPIRSGRTGRTRMPLSSPQETAVPVPPDAAVVKALAWAVRTSPMYRMLQRARSAVTEAQQDDFYATTAEHARRTAGAATGFDPSAVREALFGGRDVLLSSSGAPADQQEIPATLEILVSIGPSVLERAQVLLIRDLSFNRHVVRSPCALGSVPQKCINPVVLVGVVRSQVRINRGNGASARRLLRCPKKMVAMRCRKYPTTPNPSLVRRVSKCRAGDGTWRIVCSHFETYEGVSHQWRPLAF